MSTTNVEEAADLLTGSIDYIEHHVEIAAPRLKSKLLKNGKPRQKAYRGEKFHDAKHNYYRKDGSFKQLSSILLWDSMTPAMQKAYLKQFPTSAFAKDLKGSKTAAAKKKTGIPKSIDEKSALVILKSDNPLKEKALLKAMPVHSDTIQKAAMSASYYNLEHLKKPNDASLAAYIKGMSKEADIDPDEVLSSLKTVLRKHKDAFSKKQLTTLFAIRDTAKYG